MGCAPGDFSRGRPRRIQDIVDWMDLDKAQTKRQSWHTTVSHAGTVFIMLLTADNGWTCGRCFEDLVMPSVLALFESKMDGKILQRRPDNYEKTKRVAEDRLKWTGGPWHINLSEHMKIARDNDDD